MTKTFTENDLVRFVYDELNEDERVEIKESMKIDFQLKEKIEDLKSVMKSLDSFTMKAPNDVVNRILYASKNLQSA